MIQYNIQLAIQYSLENKKKTIRKKLASVIESSGMLVSSEVFKEMLQYLLHILGQDRLRGIVLWLIQLKLGLQRCEYLLL